jgi:anti-anti-sigma factor
MDREGEGMTDESDRTGVSVVVGELQAGGVLVRVGGEIDISNIEQVQRLIEPVVGPATKEITFDLSEVAFIDSSGLALLLSVAERIGTVRLKSPSRQVRRIIEVTGLGAALPVEP